MINTVIFDRDGVINEVVMRQDVVSSPRALSEFHIRDEFRNLYAELARKDISTFVVSNQPDVRRGTLLEADLSAMTEILRNEFNFDEIVYCTHDDADDCLCRKPKPGMINYLVKTYGLDARSCLLVGDSQKDVLAAQAAGVSSSFLRCQYNRDHKCSPDYVIDKLEEVLQIMESSQGSANSSATKA